MLGPRATRCEVRGEANIFYLFFYGFKTLLFPVRERGVCDYVEVGLFCILNLADTAAALPFTAFTTP